MNEMELSYMDYDFFFQDGDKIIHVASGGQTFDEFIKLDEEDQESLFNYMNSLEKISKTKLLVSNEDVPDTSSFEEMSERGIYSYDCTEGYYELMTEPTTPLSVKRLPKQIQNILPKQRIQ